MATYQIPRATARQGAVRGALAVLLLAGALGLAFDVGRVTAPSARPAPATSLRQRDVTEPAWRDQLHAALNDLPAATSRT